MEDTPDASIAADAEARGEGICRTCMSAIWNEGGTVDGRIRATGWGDRRGRDSLLCFKAVDYAHVPLSGREAAIYDRAFMRGIECASAATVYYERDNCTCGDSHPGA